MRELNRAFANYIDGRAGPSTTAIKTAIIVEESGDHQEGHGDTTAATPVEDMSEKDRPNGGGELHEYHLPLTSGAQLNGGAVSRMPGSSASSDVLVQTTEEPRRLTRRATAEDLPPELFLPITTWLGNLPPTAWKAMDKRGLGACSLACRERAKIIRPFLFRELELRSPDDIQDLLVMLR